MISHASTRLAAPLALAGLLFLGTACGGGDDGDANEGGGETPAAGGATSGPMSPGYEFPADVAFDPTGWESNAITKLGSPNAVRDNERTFVLPWTRFPPTLRTDGPNANLAEQREMRLLTYESLCGVDPETEEFTAFLASHWKIETDEAAGTQTFWFRVDDRARWSDGKPVTARDVYATWWHLTQEDRQDPSNVMTFKDDYEEPEIVDRLTIKVVTKELNWRLFAYFSGFLVRSADELGIDGKTYLDEWNWKWFKGSGPYVMTDLKKGESITQTRREDWWGKDLERNEGLYNFKKLKYILIRERELVFEKFKKSEIDWFRVQKAQRWVEEIPKEDLVQKGWVQRRKIFNKSPQGVQGLAFNMRKAPFSDKRMRLAFAHLFNRERLMEKLFFNQYQFMNSYFPGRDWGAGDENEVIPFDPDRAVELMAEAGYSERDAEGFLKGPDGKRLEMTLYYVAPSWERIWLVVQEAYIDAGVKLNLERIDGATLVTKITDRQFTIHRQGFGAMLFPNPETAWRSDLADQKNNNNIPGFKSEKVDELLKTYNVTFDRAEQKKLMREIDRLLFAEHPYALMWFAGYTRVLYWDRFGHPDNYLTRVEQYPWRDMVLMWWYDPAKEATLDAAMKAGTKLPHGASDHWPWGK